MKIVLPTSLWACVGRQCVAIRSHPSLHRAPPRLRTAKAANRAAARGRTSDEVIDVLPRRAAGRGAGKVVGIMRQSTVHLRAPPRDLLNFYTVGFHEPSPLFQSPT